MALETDPIVKTGTKTTKGEEETITIEVVIEIIGLITEITVGPEIGIITETVTGIAIGPITEGKTVVKGMVTETKNAADLEIEIEIGGIGAALEKPPNPETVSKIDMRVEGRVGMIPGIGPESRSRSSSHVSTKRDRSRCYRCNEYDHFARECPNNTPNRHASDAEDYLLRMSDTDQMYALDYTDGEDFDMDLNM